jgi:hypothetical protein
MPLTGKRRSNRRAILDDLGAYLDVGAAQRRVMMRNGGGDALDAALAALGGVQAWQSADHCHIARHPRYPREGRLFV